MNRKQNQDYELKPDDLSTPVLTVPIQFETSWYCLTPKQRLVVSMYHYHNMPQSQIAKMLGKSRSSISGLLARAKDRKLKSDRSLRVEQLYLERKIPD